MDVPKKADSIGFTGSQGGMSDFQKQSLEYRLTALRSHFTWFHHGCCVGADTQAAAVAKKLGYRIAVHPPTDESSIGNMDGDYAYPADGYLERDRGIVNESSVLLAAPLRMVNQRRSGTWYTIRYAEKTGIPITILARMEK